MGAILVLSATVVAGTFGWAARRLRSLGPGPERDAHLNSFWFLGASAAIMLALVMGVEPFTQPLFVRWTTLTISGVMTVVGVVNARRLAAARRRQLVAARREAVTVADRVESVEALGAMDLGPPTRVRLMAIGVKLMVGGSFAWSASILPIPTATALLVAAAVGHVLWAGADVVGLVRSRKARLELDEEIDALLAAPGDADS